jgi:hypothetical protein
MVLAARRFEMLWGLAAFSLLAGCSVDRAEKTELVPVGPRDFEYHVTTDWFYSPDPEGGAERIRLRWLANDVDFAKLCMRDYDILSRQVIFQYATPAGYPVDEIIYRGRCRV